MDRVDDRSVTTDELAMILGRKEVEIYILNRENAILRKALEAVKPKREAVE
jgi:hypothetical protein